MTSAKWNALFDEYRRIGYHLISVIQAENELQFYNPPLQQKHSLDEEIVNMNYEMSHILEKLKETVYYDEEQRYQAYQRPIDIRNTQQNLNFSTNPSANNMAMVAIFQDNDDETYQEELNRLKKYLSKVAVVFQVPVLPDVQVENIETADKVVDANFIQYDRHHAIQNNNGTGSVFGRSIPTQIPNSFIKRKNKMVEAKTLERIQLPHNYAPFYPNCDYFFRKPHIKKRMNKNKNVQYCASADTEEIFQTEEQTEKYSKPYTQQVIDYKNSDTGYTRENYSFIDETLKGEHYPQRNQEYSKHTPVGGTYEYYSNEIASIKETYQNNGNPSRPADEYMKFANNLNTLTNMFEFEETVPKLAKQKGILKTLKNHSQKYIDYMSSEMESIIPNLKINRNNSDKTQIINDVKPLSNAQVDDKFRLNYNAESNQQNYIQGDSYEEMELFNHYPLHKQREQSRNFPKEEGAKLERDKTTVSQKDLTKNVNKDSPGIEQINKYLKKFGIERQRKNGRDTANGGGKREITKNEYLRILENQRYAYKLQIEQRKIAENRKRYDKIKKLLTSENDGNVKLKQGVLEKLMETNRSLDNEMIKLKNRSRNKGVMWADVLEKCNIYVAKKTYRSLSILRSYTVWNSQME